MVSPLPLNAGPAELLDDAMIDAFLDFLIEEDAVFSPLPIFIDSTSSSPLEGTNLRESSIDGPMPDIIVPKGLELLNNMAGSLGGSGGKYVESPGMSSSNGAIASGRMRAECREDSTLRPILDPNIEFADDETTSNTKCDSPWLRGGKRKRKGAVIAAAAGKNIIGPQRESAADQSGEYTGSGKTGIYRTKGQNVQDVVARLPLERLEGAFRETLGNASAVLGVSTATLKKLCRERGVYRWPYRQVTSLDRKILSIEQQIRTRKQEGKCALLLMTELALLEKHRSELIETSTASLTSFDLNRNCGSRPGEFDVNL